MREQSVFHLITEITRKEKIACVLIGGFAVNHYKVSRQTADVDLLVTRDDFEKMSAFLQKAGYKTISSQENFVQLQSTRLSCMDIDFMFVDHDTLQKILDEGEHLKITGQDFIVPSLNHLIALKLHSIKCNPSIRLTKDLPDIINLIRINTVDAKKRNFRNLCLKYGTEEIYTKILEAFK